MSSTAPATRRRSLGVGLIEVLIALVVGALAVIVVLQVLRVSESARRTTIGGDDALNRGAIAMAALQRDLRQAGHGLDLVQSAGCNVSLPGALELPALAPVTINPTGVPAGDPGTDTVRVVYGDGLGSPEGSVVHGQQGANAYMVGAPTEFAAEDLVLAVPAERPLPCLLQVEAVRSVDGAQALVNVETGRHAMSQGTLHNLGRAPQALVYAVRAGRLSVCDLLRSDCTRAADVDNPAVWAPVAADVASLRVQYGRDTTVPMDGVVDTWDQQTPTTACGWARVRAVRLVLVARGGAFEREVVTPTAPSWSGSLAAADNVPAPVDLSAQTDWQHFRYRSFETTVPLRNLTWREAVPGC